jgi:hypothetical protein
MSTYLPHSYIDSMATIRRTSQPFQYVLAINRVFEEGEETLEDEEQECRLRQQMVATFGKPQRRT